MKRFECVDECSDCCIKREYYPSKKFGKVGVLVLPEEKESLERMASEMGVPLCILPRIGASDYTADGPDEILAYQMMGRDADGDTCPFLDQSGRVRSPHGGLGCMIYQDRPLACRAYPLIDTAPAQLDSKCRFCHECGNADAGLEQEAEALAIIRGRVRTDRPRVWRYATGVGGAREVLRPGWIAD